jgi:hypothetical protein
MKKITLSVAALSLAISGFCTNPDSTNIPNNNELVIQITNTTEDLIEWIREDEWNGRIMTKESSDIYVKHLLNILSKIEDLQIKQSQEKYNNSLNCENCDEID